MTHLSEKNCRIIQESEEALEENDLTHYLAQIHESWNIEDESALRREFNFPSHSEALDFTNKISELAMSEEYYPSLELSYGSIQVSVQASELEGLHENDFILAAKIDRLSN